MIPLSLVEVCKELPSTDLSAMKKAWKNYRTTKQIPDTKEEKLALGSILNLNRKEYTAVTGLSPFQSMYLFVNKIPTPFGVVEHKKLREALTSPLEKVLLYPSISMALYAETALKLFDQGLEPTLDTRRYTEYLESIDRNLAYRQSTGLLVSATEETNCIFLETALDILGIENFSKRFFLQGKVLFGQVKQTTKYDVVSPLTLAESEEKTTYYTSHDQGHEHENTEHDQHGHHHVGDDLTNPISALFSQSDVTTRAEIEAVWRKLKSRRYSDFKAVANYIRDNLTDNEKMAAINLINQTRPHFMEITTHTKLASPLHILLKKPVEQISREEHIALRELLLEEGGLTSLYLLYPSLSIAVQAQAALATNWPQGGQELAIKFRAFMNHCGANYQNRLNVRLLKRAVDEPDDPLYKEMRRIVPLAATRHVYQGAVLFCRVQPTSMYDINNVVSLRGECISEWGAELPENKNIKYKYSL